MIFSFQSAFSCTIAIQVAIQVLLLEGNSSFTTEKTSRFHFFIDRHVRALRSASRLDELIVNEP